MSALNGSLQTMCAAATALVTFTRNATSGGRKRRLMLLRTSPIRCDGWIGDDSMRDRPVLRLPSAFFVVEPTTSNSRVSSIFGRGACGVTSRAARVSIPRCSLIFARKIARLSRTGPSWRNARRPSAGESVATSSPSSQAPTMRMSLSKSASVAPADLRDTGHH